MSTATDNNQTEPSPAYRRGPANVLDILNSRFVYAGVSVIILLSVFYLQGRLLAEVDKLYLRKETFQTHQEQTAKFQARTEQAMEAVQINRVSMARIEADIATIKESLRRLEGKLGSVAAAREP